MSGQFAEVKKCNHCLQQKKENILSWAVNKNVSSTKVLSRKRWQ